MRKILLIVLICASSCGEENKEPEDNGTPRCRKVRAIETGLNSLNEDIPKMRARVDAENFYGAWNYCSTGKSSQPTPYIDVHGDLNNVSGYKVQDRLCHTLFEINTSNRLRPWEKRKTPDELSKKEAHEALDEAQKQTDRNLKTITKYIKTDCKDCRSFFFLHALFKCLN
ncbi:MAG: hypothetical protein OXC44_03490 [Proteobacteria bacterium]|nr:hypothetical protein [Pseudomonadota bacterium]